MSYLSKSVAAILVFASGQAEEGIRAVECKGDKELAEPLQIEAGDYPIIEGSRVYIIDHTKEDVAFFNPTIDELVYLCDDSEEYCAKYWHQALMVLIWHGDEGGSRTIVIDRKEGTLSDVMTNGAASYIFKGYCELATVPRVDPKDYKF